MSCYVVATIKVHDPETYRRYTAQVPALVARHGGKFLTRGGGLTTDEGEPFTDRMVIIEFPDRAHAEAWSADPDYAPVRALRQSASTGRLVFQDGVTDSANPNPNV